MSNYTKTTNFSTKDSLPSGDPNKIVKGAEINTEFDNIATAVATKSNLESPAFTGTVTIPTADINGGAIDGTTIGGATAAPVTSTTLTANTSLNIAGDGATVTGIKDEDDMASNSATKLATQQSIKAYVDSQVTAQDLDVTTDSGTIAIDLDSETLTVTGGTGLSSSATGNAVTLDIDSTVATLTGTQTLTNKTLTTPVISGNLTTDGTIDGRDVAADGSKLDGIESGATADQTAAEIRTLVESATDSNVFTDADHSKLNGIEANADVTDTTNVVAALSAGTGISLSAGGEIANTAPDQTVALTGAGGTTISGTYPNFTISSTAGGGETLAQTLAIGNTTGGADISFGDTDKATFGASADLQIYHDGSNSFIQDVGTGDLIIYGTGEDLAKFKDDGAVELYHNGSQKLATTSTGIDVTGTVSADGLTVDGLNADIKTTFGGTSEISNFGHQWTGSAFKANLKTNYPFYVQNQDKTKNKLLVNTNGDISFYEDTGTTPKFFWDASAESLGIGTNSPTAPLTVNGGSDNLVGMFESSDTLSYISFKDSNTTSDTSVALGASGDNFTVYTGTSFGSERMRIDSSGNLLVGKTSADNTTAGCRVRGDGFASFVRSGAEPLLINRLTNDGSLLTLQKGGGTVGSIGNNGTRLFAGSGATGLMYDGSNNYIVPCNTSTNAGRDGAIDLGVSTFRYKDLHLSGSGYFGTNVGIGTTSPTAKLEVLATAPTYTNLGTVLWGGTTNNDNHTGISLSSSGDALGGSVGSNLYYSNSSTATQSNTNRSSGEIKIDNTTSTGTSTIRFGGYAKGTTTFDEHMRIDSSGNVGIGTASPDKALTISASDSQVRLYDADGTNQFASFQSDNGITKITSRNNTSHGQIAFQTYNGTSVSERARIDSSGNQLIGTTTTYPGVSGLGGNVKGFMVESQGSIFASRNDGNIPAYFNRGTDGAIISLRRASTAYGTIGAVDVGNGFSVYMATDAKGLRIENIQGTGSVIPCNGSGAILDNSIDLGKSTARFDDVYATNGTIQTSDRNEKQDIEVLSDAEQRVAVACKGLLRKFRWKSAVEEKGDEARIHFGIIAQDLQDAFTAEGLDAGDYAMFINTTWTDEETGEERSRMGVRYSELLAFIISAI